VVEARGVTSLGMDFDVTGGPGKESEGRPCVQQLAGGFLLVGFAPMTSWHRDF